MQIPDIKKHLTILQVLSHYGIKPDPSTSSGRSNQINCPFHDDDKPSCKIYPETNTFHCFGCGATGDQIEFCVKMEASTGSATDDKHKGILKATELAAETKDLDVTGVASKKAASVEVTNFAGLFAKQKEGLPRSPKALKYLKDRGLEQLKDVGYNSGVNWNKLKQCLTFPLKDKNGNIVSLYGRRVTNDSESHTIEYGKHYYSENRKGLYPNYPNQNTETLIITEAIIDAASLALALGSHQSYQSTSILSAYGTNGLTTEHKTAIKALEKLKEIIFFFDGDHAGKDGTRKYAEELKVLNLQITTVPTPDGEDVNTLWLNYGKEAILQLIQERKPVEENPLFSIEPTLNEGLSEAMLPPPGVTENPSKSAQSVSSVFQLDVSIPNKITYPTPTARYTVKGTLCKQLDKMLVSLDIQHLETGLKYRCRLDLYEEKQTRKEAREASEKLDLRADLIETDLSKLTDLLEELRDNQLRQTQEEMDTDKALNLAEQAKCKALLQKNGLLQNINELIGKSGITGEENNRLFLFVIATSHKMPDTLHALIQGSSGSGKTHLLSKIAALMPPERVVKFTRVTENSFYNYDEYFFKGKLICLEDIDGLKEEALFAWRELISNNQLSSSTSIKDENGNIRSAQRIVRGPMASICATTHGQIYEDNMSRLFIIAVDESEGQTQKIIQYQSLAASGIAEKEKENEAKIFLQNCVRMLKPLQVVNPYADKIKLPPQAHKIRRLHELFLSFVKQVTLINQYQRKKDAKGRIITEPEDLKTAVEIMFESIFLKVDELDGSLRQFFEQLKEYVLQKQNPQQYEFTQREVRHGLGISKTQLQRYMNELMELEYLTVAGGYQNKGLRYKISYWDNIGKLRTEIKEYLNNQLDKL